MTIHYLDSSVWVKRYLDEEGSSRVHELFKTKEVLASSGLGRVEVAAAIARQSGARRLDDRSRRVIELQLDREWSLFLQANTVQKDFESAVDLTRRFYLRGADALHLAVSWELSQQFEAKGDHLVLHTSDRELAAAARKAGIAVEDPLAP